VSSYKGIRTFDTPLRRKLDVHFLLIFGTIYFYSYSYFDKLEVASRIQLAPISTSPRGSALMPSQNIRAENGVAADPSTWAGRTVLVVGAATGMGQAVATAFAAAGAHRIALVDSGDLSVTQYRALQAASVRQLAPPELLTLHLDPEDSARLDRKVTEVSRKWGHLDFIINHAEDDKDKGFETGFKNIYAVIDAFFPLLLAGSEKTFINIIPDSSSVSRPGKGAHMIVEMANRQMADLLMADHGDEGLLAYSVHSSRFSTKGISPSASKGMLACHKKLESSGETLTLNS
jgi:NAD(P)-dependent dehydrogenase (short-subunit alcohol dehydrogenase family)